MSGNVTKDQVDKGHALPAPGQDRAGRYPIENVEDLKKAIAAVGRAAGGGKGRAMVRRFIMKRARALKVPELIPANWNADGTTS